MRGLPRFEYARDKTETDRLCQLWAASTRTATMTIVRPTIVFGPERRQLHRPVLDQRSRSSADGGTIDRTSQFVHEDDVVEAISGLLLDRHGGTFNLTGDGMMTNRECAELIAGRSARCRCRLYRRIARVMWKLRQRRGAARADRVRAAPLDALEREAQADDRLDAAHTSRETFEITMRAHGKLPPAETAEDRVSRCYAGRLKHSQGR